MSEMDSVIWLHSWIREARENLKPFFVVVVFFFFFFYLLLGPFRLFMLLFRDASVLTREVGGHSSTGAIPLSLPNALSL